MSGFLQPDPVLLAFALVKEWIYLVLLLPFALLRAPLCRGPARRAALLGLGLTCVFVAAVFLPSILGLSSGPLFRLGGFVGGMAVPLVCSAPLLAAAVLPGRRFWGLDALHLIGVAGLIGLWVYSVTS